MSCLWLVAAELVAGTEAFLVTTTPVAHRAVVARAAVTSVMAVRVNAAGTTVTIIMTAVTPSILATIVFKSGTQTPEPVAKSACRFPLLLPLLFLSVLLL